jgi:hypothetical protein
MRSKQEHFCVVFCMFYFRCTIFGSDSDIG